MVEFVDIEPVSSSIIMVVGVGGGGSNAVNHMYKLGITDVSFMVCNTDRQALGRSPIPTQIRLGETLTEGLGAGNKPERGRAAAEESIEEIREVFREKNIKMVFVTAGMGGGTGTGAAPVIAKAAKEMGILTVAIVTIPFKTEGRRRILQAIDGIEEIRHNVDSLLVVNNENIHEIYGELTLSEAFGKADDILATAAKSIAEIITQEYRVNVDFADVQTVMKDSGIALMGSARGSGENRAREVAEAAMSSPLLNHKDISGAKNVLLNITSGNKEVTLTETYQITQFMQERTGNDNSTDLIWGAGTDESLGDDIRITVIATGFDIDSIPAIRERYAEVVGRDPNARRNGMGTGRPVAGQNEGPKRETISLIDQEGGAGYSGRADKKAKAGSGDEGDDFSVVTHDRGEPQFAASHTAYDRPSVSIAEREREMVAEERQPVVDAPMTETPIAAVEPVPAPAPVPVVEVTPPVQVVQAVETVVEPVAPEPQRANDDDITALTEEQIENIPAYIRRRMKIYAGGAPAGGKVSRETLKNEGGSGGSHSRGGGAADGGHHLFD